MLVAACDAEPLPVYQAETFFALDGEHAKRLEGTRVLVNGNASRGGDIGAQTAIFDTSSGMVLLRMRSRADAAKVKEGHNAVDCKVKGGLLFDCRDPH